MVMQYVGESLSKKKEQKQMSCQNPASQLWEFTPIVLSIEML